MELEFEFVELEFEFVKLEFQPKIMFHKLDLLLDSSSVDFIFLFLKKHMELEFNLIYYFSRLELESRKFEFFAGKFFFFLNGTRV